MNIVMVALGGAVGSVLRFLISSLNSHAGGSSFPLGTLIVNIVGSFIIGFVGQLISQSSANHEYLSAFITKGFCGGFTTFSTFSSENVAYIQGEQYGLAAGYITISLVSCLLGTFCGIVLARKFKA